MDWTGTQEARLRELWAEGLSSAAIGRVMHLTKNQIIGKAHRLGLPRRESPVANFGATQAEASARKARHLIEIERLRGDGFGTTQIARQLGVHANTVTKLASAAGMPSLRGQVRRVLPKVVAEPPPPAPVPVAAHPLMRMGASGCRFPVGQPRKAGFRFCDATPVVPGKPYCAACCARAYVRVADYAPQPGGMILPVGRAA